ncbi:MFS transporter [Aureimonas endophytica]|uniref:MFS transporter n=1 Tax=Aureimonas endophytica TaxID=2027858 RepID=A0A916ZEP7_9HYPH|nr:MFS transporter [Aureimonas endophytica]GGD93193.1 MFS transporter [Aureimonas endophytica]
MSTLLPIVSLLLSVFFLMSGAGLLGIVLPVRGSIEGWSTYEIGLLGTGYAVAFTVGCLLVPRLLRRVGHVRTFSSLCALLAIAVLLNALVVHPIAWIVFRGTAGFALAGSYMVIESWLNERVNNETRGRIFSIYMIVSMSAMMSGQFMMPLARPETPNPFMFCAILFALAVIPTALSRAPSPKPLEAVKLDLQVIFRNSPAAAVGVFLAGMISGSWNNMAPVFAQRIGFSTAEIAALLAVTQAGGIALQYPLGRVSDRVDRRHVMTGIGLLGLAVALFGLFFLRHDVVLVLATAFVLGSVAYPAYSLAVAHANDYARPADFVRLSGGLLILYGFGTMGGPLFSAWLMERLGPSGIFAATGAGHGLYAAYAFYRTFRRQAPPVSARPDFRSTPLARTQTPAALRLDPRSEEKPSGA